jgi:copper chaperone CopZ
MLKSLVLGLLLILASYSSFSQVKPTLNATIKTPTAQCENCKIRIENYLKGYDGILTVLVNFRKGETRVKYLSDRTDIEQIKTAISNAGYDADDVPANPDSYNRLPKSCKKNEDGGGHPKPKILPSIPAN